ncbi:MAG: hypothetical protein GY941_22780, partial [Planctomycetes bacterium]|nr:hypothetical protein [Planctomycetota bacterium]
MIFTDMGVAFTVPPWMVERRFWKKLPEVSARIWKDFKPKVETMKKEILFSVMTAVNRKLDQIVKNEIPHIIDERIEKLDDRLDNVHQMITEDFNFEVDEIERNINDKIKTVIDHVDTKVLDLKQDLVITSKNAETVTVAIVDLQNQLAKTLGATGGMAKKAKEIERLKLIQNVIKEHPEKQKSIENLYMFKKIFGLSQKDFDTGLMFITGGISGMIGGMQVGSQELPTVPMVQGQALNQKERQSVCEETRQGSSEQAPLATSGVVITDKDKINSLKGSLVEQGIPKELVNQWAKKGKEANKEKKA